MKNLVLLIALLAFSGFASAASVRYTFSGTVSNVNDGGSAGDVSVGDQLSYVFDVDTSRDGFYILTDGRVINQQDRSGYDYFYADFVAGGLLDGDTLACPGTCVEEYNYGWAFSRGSSTRATYLTGGESYDFSQVYSGLLHLSDWAVGTSVLGYESFTGTDGARSIVYSSLTVTSITAVPVPAAVWLFGSALLGFIGLNRRKAIRSQG